MDKGVIFDWDGVIIDSHEAHEISWNMLAEELNSPLPEGAFKETFGMKNETIIPHYFKWADPDDTTKIQELGDRKESLYRDVIRKNGIEPLPGVVNLLEALTNANIPKSVGSSTPTENILTIMEITGLGPQFDAITAAEDVNEGKPNPQVFLKAAAKINREPTQCVVIEDAHIGIEAALNAGMKAIAVATTHPKDSFSDAHLAVQRLTEVSVKNILQLLEH